MKFHILGSVAIGPLQVPFLAWEEIKVIISHNQPWVKRVDDKESTCVLNVNETNNDTMQHIRRGGRDLEKLRSQVVPKAATWYAAWWPWVLENYLVWRVSLLALARALLVDTNAPGSPSIALNSMVCPIPLPYISCWSSSTWAGVTVCWCDGS